MAIKSQTLFVAIAVRSIAAPATEVVSEVLMKINPCRFAEKGLRTQGGFTSIAFLRNGNVAVTVA
jgi:hypothetical protein